MRVPPSKHLAFALMAAALVAAACSGRGKTAVTQPSCKPNETLAGGKCTPSIGAQAPLSPLSPQTAFPPSPPTPPSPPLGPLSPSPDNGTLTSPTPGSDPLSPSSPTVAPTGPRPPSSPSPAPSILPSPGPRPPSSPSPLPSVQPSPGPRPPAGPSPTPAQPSQQPTNVTPPSLGAWNGAPANAGDGAPWVKVVYVTSGGRLVAFAALSHKEQVSDFKFIFGKEAVPAPGAASTSGGFVGNAALKLPVKLELLFNNVKQCYSAEAGFAEVTVEPKPC